MRMGSSGRRESASYFQIVICANQAVMALLRCFWKEYKSISRKSF